MSAHLFIFTNFKELLLIYNLYTYTIYPPYKMVYAKSLLKGLGGKDAKRLENTNMIKLDHTNTGGGEGTGRRGRRRCGWLSGMGHLSK